MLLYLVTCCITLNHILVQGYIPPLSQGKFLRTHEYWQLRSTSKNSRVESASEDLLSLLLDTNKSKHDDEFQIESLINFLKETNSQFNPDVSLNGPLYAVVYQSGPRPFWEKFDLGLSLGTKKRKNIKGQKYTKVSDGVYNVQNYAEFIGQQFSVEAKGVCTRSNAVKEPKRNATQFTRLFEQTFKKNSSSLVQCPADYDITATGFLLTYWERSLILTSKGKVICECCIQMIICEF